MNISDAKEYFCHLHNVEVNQKYNNNLPYSFHLDMVDKQIYHFLHLISGRDNKEIVRICGYGHDSIEDARLTYNNIKERFGVEVAEIIYLCTEFKGRTRDERKPDQFYIELKTSSLAVFVKLCDLIANVKFSLLTNSSFYETYKIEYELKIKKHLMNSFPEYNDIFSYLDKLLNIN